MPQSLWDMFQPQDAAGEPTGFGNALTSRSNSLIGLGLGMLQPSRPLQGESTWGNALQGFQGGAQLDARTATAAAARRQHAADRAQAQAQHAADRAQSQSNFERQFARSDPANAPTEFTRAARDLGLTPGTPEHTEFAKSFYAPKTEQPTIVWQEDSSGDKVPYRQDPRAGSVTPIPLPGGTATAAADAPTAPAQRHGITLPSGEVVTPPPGLNKEARKAWSADVAKTVADMQTGKMTEGQAKYSIYATGMQIAQQELQNLESQGTSQWGKSMAAVPWGAGNYFQTKEYQAFRTAKDAWLNAKLRAESGATVNPDEFARDERIFFPMPGDGPQQIADKARLREHITSKMTKAGGPGYTAPPPLASAPAAPAATGGKTPPPPAGFTILAP